MTYAKEHSGFRFVLSNTQKSYRYIEDLFCPKPDFCYHAVFVIIIIIIIIIIVIIIIITNTFIGGAHDGAVCSGNALQTAWSRVRFPMESLKDFIDFNLPAVLWP